jgi:hypothetical protein
MWIMNDVVHVLVVCSVAGLLGGFAVMLAVAFRIQVQDPDLVIPVAAAYCAGMALVYCIHSCIDHTHPHTNARTHTQNMDGGAKKSTHVPRPPSPPLIHAREAIHLRELVQQKAPSGPYEADLEVKIVKLTEYQMWRRSDDLYHQLKESIERFFHRFSQKPYSSSLNGDATLDIETVQFPSEFLFPGERELLHRWLDEAGWTLVKFNIYVARNGAEKIHGVTLLLKE